MNRFLLGSIALLVTVPTLAAQDRFARPPITGIHHIRFYSSNLDKSRAFYAKNLGLTSADSRCSYVAYLCFAVNSGPHPQHIELQQAPATAPKDWLAELAFSTDDVLKLRLYLMTHGVEPGRVVQAPDGSQHFVVRDPEGNLITFVGPASSPASPISEPHAISSRIIHAGFVVKNREVMDRFYKGILGFRLYWHGGMKDTDTDWVAMQVPDGTDWLEYMLNVSPTADKQTLGVMNHVSLGVKDIKVAEASLHASRAKMRADDSPKIGRDGKWQYNLYDPDDTRVELMEFAPVQKPCCSEISGPNPQP